VARADKVYSFIKKVKKKKNGQHFQSESMWQCSFRSFRSSEGGVSFEKAKVILRVLNALNISFMVEYRAQQQDNV